MAHFDAARLAALSTTLKSGPTAAKRQALETTPIVPPNGDALVGKMVEKNAANNWVNTVRSTEGPFAASADWTKLKYEQSGDMLGFIEMSVPRIEEFVGAASFKVKLAAEIARATDVANLIPCWWLPWLSRHIIKIKIASLATAPTINLGGTKGSVPNPGLFFTAAINGCSVFAVGDARAPSLYHAGLTGSLEKALGAPEFRRLGGTSEAVWRQLLGRAGTAKQIGETNRDRYVAQRTSPTAAEESRYMSGENFDKYTTLEALRLEANLNRRNDITGVTVIPWGAVFGIRDDAGSWSFTLVRNATVTYYYLVRKKKFVFSKPVSKAVGEKRVGIDRLNSDGSTMDLSALDKDARDKAFAERICSIALNLGHEQFFPGGGAAVYQDFNTFQII